MGVLDFLNQQKKKLLDSTELDDKVVNFYRSARKTNPQQLYQMLDRDKTTPGTQFFNTKPLERMTRDANPVVKIGGSVLAPFAKQTQQGFRNLEEGVKYKKPKKIAIGAYQTAKTPIALMGGVTPALFAGGIGAGIRGGLAKTQGLDPIVEAGKGFQEGLNTRAVTRFTDPAIGKLVSKVAPASGLVKTQLAQRTTAGLANIGEDEIINQLEGYKTTGSEMALSFLIGTLTAGNQDLIRALGGKKQATKARSRLIKTQNDYKAGRITKQQARQQVNEVTGRLRDARGRFARQAVKVGQKAKQFVLGDAKIKQIGDQFEIEATSPLSGRKTVQKVSSKTLQLALTKDAKLADLTPQARRKVFEVQNMIGQNGMSSAMGGVAGFETYQDENGKTQFRYNPAKGVLGVAGMVAGKKALKNSNVRIVGSGDVPKIDPLESLKAEVGFETLPSSDSYQKELSKVGAKRIAPYLVPHHKLTPIEGVEAVRDQIQEAVGYLKNQSGIARATQVSDKFVKEYEELAEKVSVGGASPLEKNYVDGNVDFYEMAKRQNFLYNIIGRSKAKKLRKNDLLQVANEILNSEKLSTDVYRDLIKNDIKKGFVFPDEVLNFDKSFRTAQNARARYEKGLFTSFSADDQRIVFDDTGRISVGMKRQDGSDLLPEQKEEIISGFQDVKNILGIDIDRIAKDDRWVIAHLNDKNPFLKKAGGLYREDGKGNISVSVGGSESFTKKINGKIKKITVPTTMAHELGHALDYKIDNKFLDSATYRKLVYSMNPVDWDFGKGSKYWTSRVEVTARALEQYVAVKKGLNSIYGRQAYWKKEIFDKEILPAIEKSINKNFSKYKLEIPELSNTRVLPGNSLVPVKNNRSLVTISPNRNGSPSLNPQKVKIKPPENVKINPDLDHLMNYPRRLKDLGYTDNEIAQISSIQAKEILGGDNPTLRPKSILSEVAEKLNLKGQKELEINKGSAEFAKELRSSFSKEDLKTINQFKQIMRSSPDLDFNSWRKSQLRKTNNKTDAIEVVREAYGNPEMSEWDVLQVIENLPNQADTRVKTPVDILNSRDLKKVAGNVSNKVFISDVDLPSKTPRSKIGKDFNEWNKQLRKQEGTITPRQQSIKLVDRLSNMVGQRLGGIGDTPEEILERAKSKIGTKKQIDKKSLKQHWKKFYSDWVNALQPIEDLRNQAIRVGGTLKNDPKVAITRFLGAGGKAELRQKQNVQPVIDELSDLGISNSDFDIFLKAQRDIELGSRVDPIYGSDPLMARKVIESLSQKYDVPKMEELANRLYTYQNKLLAETRDAGFLTQDAFDNITASNQKYVPFDRIMDDIDDFIGLPARSLQQGSQVIQKIKGSERKILSPLESVIANTYKMESAIAKNRVAQSIVSLKDVPGFENVIKEAKKSQTKGTISVWENGSKKYYQVPEDVVTSVKGLDEEQTNLVIEVLSAPARMLRQQATGRNLDFMIPNAFRDQFEASFNSKYGYRPFLDYFDGLRHWLNFKFKKSDDVVEEWINSGGSMFFENMEGRKAISQQISDAKQKRFTKKLYDWAVGGIDFIGDISEKPTRIGLYKRARKAGADTFESALESREGTLDFARRGARMKVANSIIPFLNVSVQGFDRYIRTWKSNPGASAIKTAVYAGTPALTLSLYNNLFHPEEYAGVPDFEKEANWIFLDGGVDANGDPTYFKLPKSHWQQYVSNPVDNLVTAVAGQNPQTFQQVALGVLSGMLPVVGEGNSMKEIVSRTVGGNLPQMFKPPIEALSNYSFFKGDKIDKIPDSKPPEEHFYSTTPEPYKYIGNVIQQSPLKIKNTVEGYAPLVKQGVNMFDTVAKLSQGENPNINNVPITRRFYGSREGYDIDRPEQQEGESFLSRLLKPTATTEASEGVKIAVPEDKEQFKELYKQAQSKATGFSEKVTKIKYDPTLSEKEKEQKIQEIREDILPWAENYIKIQDQYPEQVFDMELDIYNKEGSKSTTDRASWAGSQIEKATTDEERENLISTLYDGQVLTKSVVEALNEQYDLGLTKYNYGDGFRYLSGGSGGSGSRKSKYKKLTSSNFKLPTIKIAQPKRYASRGISIGSNSGNSGGIKIGGFAPIKV